MGETTSQAPAGTSVSNAAPLKYADPRDLPGFPSSGLRPDGAAASAAASLGWANQKPVELWKPDKTSSASAAAVLAKDYKMAPSWEPGANSAGHKAAVLAVGGAGTALKQSQSNHQAQQDGWGSSAANQAFHATRPSPAQQPASSHGATAATQAFTSSRPSAGHQASSSHGASAATLAFNANRSQSIKKPSTPAQSEADRSLAAAKGAMRPRAISTPPPTHPNDAYVLEASAASGALSGAAQAHRASMTKSPAPDAGAVSVTTMTRNMFTSHPPVKPEMDEQQHNDKMHQDAVAMAQKMYKMQQRSQEAKERGEDTGQSGTYLNLQDAAYKQAQERLAKLHDAHQQSREFQAYYGNAPATKRRFSVVNKLHRRSSSDGAMTSDRERSETIRKQMSMFSDKLSEVDKNKRKEDREALLAAAQRNVKARLQGMDQKVTQDTGMVNPTMATNWDAKAQQAAQTRHETRVEHQGKIDIGGGRFLDPEEINAIASKRVQPVLDDINEKAEVERERQATLKMEEEARKAAEERDKARERELKEDKKKAKGLEKQEERAKKQQEKEDEKARKDEGKSKKEEEKAVKAEQKRQAKEEKRKSKQSTTSGVDQAQSAEANDAQDEDAEGTRDEPVRPTMETDLEAGDEQPDSASPTSPTSKFRVKGWFKNRFSRSKSISEQEGKDAKEKDGKRRSFLTGLGRRTSKADESAASLDNRPSSMRDVAMAGKGGDDEARRDSRGVSLDSSDSDEVEAGPSQRHGLNILPPRPLEDPVERKSSSPTRETRFREMMDQ